ncbi:MAG TPA: DUF29 domain-containing protein [Azospirillum sp.]
MDRAATDYDADFYTWTQEQADALRRAADARVNVPVDWHHLAEEVESLGSEQAYALQSALMRVMEHLLKLQHSPAQEPRAGWQVSVVKHRREAQRRLKRNPGLKGKLADLFAEAWTDARALAAASLATYDGVDPETLPEECPWPVEEVLGERL